MRWLVILAVAVRVAAAAVLVAGPWTNQATELAGWDVARFQQMADEPGRPYADHEVEYPPGSVVLIEALAGGGVVRTHRLLVSLSLAVDLGVAALVRRLGGNRAAGAYLLLGLPLVPMGLLRFDLWAALAAVGAMAVALGRGRREPWRIGTSPAVVSDRPAASEPAGRPGPMADMAVALLVTAGALVKVWPALLVAALWAVGRARAAGLCLVAMALAGAGWLVWAGRGLDPVGQVLSLRGATGWHVESIPGSLVALFGSAEPELQLDAFRIGHLDPRLVLAGRVLTVAVVALLALSVRRRPGASPDRCRPDPGDQGGADAAVTAAARLILGATAALIVSAPLLSPQFLLWLTPWAALLAPRPAVPGPLSTRPRLDPVGLTGLAAAITGLTLALFGPSGVGRAVPATLLLLRDLMLILVVLTVARLAGGGDGGRGGAEPAPQGDELRSRR